MKTKKEKKIVDSDIIMDCGSENESVMVKYFHEEEFILLQKYKSGKFVEGMEFDGLNNLAIYLVTLDNPRLIYFNIEFYQAYIEELEDSFEQNSLLYEELVRYGKNENVVLRGEIYYTRLPYVENSSIQYGIRPVLIIQNNMGNKSGTNTIVVAFTSKLNKKKIKTHLEYKGCLPRKSILQCEQIFTIPKKELFNYVGKADKNFMNEVCSAVKTSLGLYYER